MKDEQSIIGHMLLQSPNRSLRRWVSRPTGNASSVPPPASVFMLVRGPLAHYWPSEEGRPCSVARFRVVSPRPKRWVLP
jgi:hypothetical protein